jgi:DNA repair protein RecO (recombination protein O)
MRYFTTPGLILKKTPSGENDWYLTIFTPELGKIQAICRSSRKITSQKGNHLDVLNLCQFQFYKNNNRYLITDCKVERPFMKIKSNLPKSLAAFTVLEILLRSIQEDEVNHQLFSLTLHSLEKISHKNTDLHLEEFKIKLIRDGGSWPDISNCFYCQKRWLSTSTIACNLQGHLTCLDCLKLSTSLVETIPFHAVKLAKYLSEHDLDEIQLRITPEELFQLKKLTNIFLTNYLHLELKSEKLAI